jgi:hypothetical protein
MNYDSQRIQQQGWQIEEPKEIGIIEAEYGESEVSTAIGWEYWQANKHYKSYWKIHEIDAHKKRSIFPDWSELAWRYMENKNRDYNAHYIRNREKQLERKKKYRQLERVKEASRGYSRKSRLIKRGDKPIKTKKPNWDLVKIWRKYESAWVSEINQDNKAFVDWSSLYKQALTDEQREYFNQKSKSYYHNLSPEKKKARNRRCMEKRYSCPIQKAKTLLKSKIWKQNNPEKTKISARKTIKNRKLRDPGFRVQCNLRNRIKDIIKSAKRGGWDGRYNFTGCNTMQLAKHLESMFNKRMTWDNYGTYWHVDHIIPCSKFDHTIQSQVAQCWHYTNLRPLEAKANMAKSDKITEPQMSLLLPCIH